MLSLLYMKLSIQYTIQIEQRMRKQEFFEEEEEQQRVGFREDEDEEDQKDPQCSNNINNNSINKRKVFLPLEFHKAKRQLNKMLNSFFGRLKEQFTERGGSIFLQPDRLEDIQNAMHYYVGIRHHKKEQSFSVKMEQPKHDRSQREFRNGVFSYLSQNQTLVNYNLDAKLITISIRHQEVDLPDVATPIPFKRNIYFLDPCRFDAKRRVFVPTQNCYLVNDRDELEVFPLKLRFKRFKCAIVRHQEKIYLCGGLATQNKISTNKCELFEPSSNMVTQMADMNQNHVGPSGCFVAGRLWVFSKWSIEYYQEGRWTLLPPAFGGRSFAFQFVHAINAEEVLIFGGMNRSEKVSEVKSFNTREMTLQNYGPILPQPLCNQRTSQPVMIQGHLVVLSSMQASKYPHVTLKESATHVTYIGSNFAYLQTICFTNS